MKIVSKRRIVAAAAVFGFWMIVGGADGLGPLTAVEAQSAPCSATPCSLWSPDVAPAALEFADETPVELGVRFHSDVNGFITGVRYYKSAANTGPHVGNLWSAEGALLATATFLNESASGWQEVIFDAPVFIVANATYVASYHTELGGYSATPNYFSSAVHAAPLHAEADADGGNGVFAFGASAFPNQSFNGANYWVDVMFTEGVDDTSPVISDVNGEADDSANAVISWTTGEGANSRVRYSTDPALPPASTATVSSAAFVRDHQIAIGGLTASTTYYFEVSSDDAMGHSSSAGVFSFSTPAPIFSDTTFAHFAKGSGVRVYTAQTGDGEVILAPAEGTEFPGAALSQGWRVLSWATGASAIVQDGLLTVDGARVAACTWNPTRGCLDTTPYLAGRSLEFVAQFSADAFQHAGFGVTLAAGSSEPWAIFSTVEGGNMVARTNDGAGTMVETVIGSSYFDAPQRYRIDWRADGSFAFSVNGVQVASHVAAVNVPMRPIAASDFSVLGGNMVADWIRMTPHADTGTFESRVFDASGAVTWNNIQWLADLPAGTSIEIGVRSGDTPVPDATWTDFVPVAAPGPLGVRSRYIQYRAALSSVIPDVTPSLTEVLITSGVTNAAPVAADDTAVALEDRGVRIHVLANDSDPDGEPLKVIRVTDPAHGRAVIATDGLSIRYRPRPNFFGEDMFRYTISDPGGDTAEAMVMVTVMPVNDAPRFRMRDLEVTAEDAGPQVVADWVPAMRPGPREQGQTIRFKVTTNDTSLFAVQPEISSDGTLTYTPAPNEFGVATLRVVAIDDGGTADGGVDRSEPQFFRIRVNPVNDAPSFTPGADQVVFALAGPRRIGGWATGIAAGPANEADQALRFLVATDTPGLFLIQPDVTPDGTLTYTPNPFAAGTARIKVRLRDSGGTLRGGIDTSGAHVLSITVSRKR